MYSKLVCKAVNSLVRSRPMKCVACCPSPNLGSLMSANWLTGSTALRFRRKIPRAVNSRQVWLVIGVDRCVVNIRLCLSRWVSRGLPCTATHLDELADLTVSAGRLGRMELRHSGRTGGPSRFGLGDEPDRGTGQ